MKNKKISSIGTSDLYSHTDTIRTQEKGNRKNEFISERTPIEVGDSRTQNPSLFSKKNQSVPSNAAQSI